MSAITKAATIIETSLPDQIANMVHIGGRFIPTGLIVASGADVMVGAGDVTAARIAVVDAGVDLVAAFLQQGIDLQELAGVGRVHRDFEPIGCLHRHHYAVAVGIDGAMRDTPAQAWCIARCARDRVKSRAAAIIVTNCRNIAWLMTLSSFCRKRNEHTEGSKCGNLHALLLGGPPLRCSLPHILMSRASMRGIRFVFQNLP